MAAVNDEWVRKNIEIYWTKGVWPANSPDPFPSKNVWAILQDKVEKADLPPFTLSALEKILKVAWFKIFVEGHENLNRSIPGRIHAVLEAKGGNVIKKCTIKCFIDDLCSLI